MTPKGIGRIVKLEENNENSDKENSELKSKVTVKFTNKDDKEETFEDCSQISSTFNVLIKIISSGLETTSWIKLICKTEDKVESILKILFKANFITEDRYFTIIFNGKKLKEDESFESIPDLFSYSKILFSPQEFIPSKIKNYNYIYTYFSITKIDSLNFKVNKDIRLTGISMFRPSDNYDVNCTLSILEGDASSEVVLCSNDLSLPFGTSEDNSLFTVTFNKHIRIKANTQYCIYAEFESDSNKYFYYGSGGSREINIENGLTFYFLDSDHSSYPSSNIYGELYYSA